MLPFGFKFERRRKYLRKFILVTQKIKSFGNFYNFIRMNACFMYALSDIKLMSPVGGALINNLELKPLNFVNKVGPNFS